MTFYSILFPALEDEARAKVHPWLTFRADDNKSAKYTMRGNKIVLASRDSKQDMPMRPGLYQDLNLVKVMDTVLCHDADDELTELFYHFCPDTATVFYRQDVMRALEDAQVRNAFQAFLQSMAKAGRLFLCGRQAHHAAQRDKYTVDGAVLYCSAIRRLLLQASALTVHAQGLLRFLDAVRGYAGEARFVRLEEQTQQAKKTLESISYSLRVNGGMLHVDFEAGTEDYAQALHQEFDAKTRWGAQMDERQMEILPFRQVELSPLEGLIMKALMEKHPKAFGEMHAAAEGALFLPEPFIGRFAREIRFYLLYLDLMIKLRGNGYAFAYPAIAEDGVISIDGAYDLALAIQTEAVVPNDFELLEGERSAVITGANQGGKTTFARSIGQIAVLTALGLPVPCERACLPLYSRRMQGWTTES